MDSICYSGGDASRGSRNILCGRTRALRHTVFPVSSPYKHSKRYGTSPENQRNIFILCVYDPPVINRYFFIHLGNEVAIPHYRRCLKEHYRAYFVQYTLAISGSSIQIRFYPPLPMAPLIDKRPRRGHDGKPTHKLKLINRWLVKCRICICT